MRAVKTNVGVCFGVMALYWTGHVARLFPLESATSNRYATSSARAGIRTKEGQKLGGGADEAPPSAAASVSARSLSRFHEPSAAAASSCAFTAAARVCRLSAGPAGGEPAPGTGSSRDEAGAVSTLCFARRHAVPYPLACARARSSVLSEHRQTFPYYISVVQGSGIFAWQQRNAHADHGRRTENLQARGFLSASESPLNRTLNQPVAVAEG